MKRLIISISLLLAILAASLAESFAVCAAADDFAENISLVEKAYSDGLTTKALDLSKSLDEKYPRYELTFLLFLDDGAVSDLSFSAARITPFLEEDSDEITAEIESIHEQLKRIKQSKLPLWYNIL